LPAEELQGLSSIPFRQGGHVGDMRE
jgi:hypothetical protein